MNNTPELLSPAGDLDKMRFGIAYGADAVYMAGTRFGMRAAATNFDDNALREGIAYALSLIHIYSESDLRSSSLSLPPVRPRPYRTDASTCRYGNSEELFRRL